MKTSDEERDEIIQAARDELTLAEQDGCTDLEAFERAEAHIEPLVERAYPGAGEQGWSRIATQLVEEAAGG